MTIFNKTDVSLRKTPLFLIVYGLVISFIGYFLSAVLGYLAIQNIIAGFIWILFGILTLLFPLLGFSLIISSSIIATLLPNIPLINSIIPVIGGLTIIGSFLQKQENKQFANQLSTVEIMSLIWFVWAIFSNPNASLLGSDRTWIFTFIQLWVLVLLTNKLVVTTKDQKVLMVMFIITILVSALSIIIQNGISEVSLSNRASGLSGGANTSARYFTYGFILLSYFLGEPKNKLFVRIIILFGLGILVIALLNTVSRTGFLLFLISIFLLLRFSLKRFSSSIAIFVFVGVLIVINLSDINNSVLSPERMINSVMLGSDTVGYRYYLWKAGWAMWLDHPITGVGIGQFGRYLGSYWVSSQPITGATPHNTYIQVLSETGIIGLIIFIFLIGSVFNNFWRNIQNGSAEEKSLNWVWLIILIILLVGAITKVDTIDKVLWFTFGVSTGKPEKKGFLQVNKDASTYL